MKWCWICSNEGIGGNQEHDSKEHEERMRESWRQIREQEELFENTRKHQAWVTEQPEWNPL